MLEGGTLSGPRTTSLTRVPLPYSPYSLRRPCCRALNTVLRGRNGPANPPARHGGLYAVSFRGHCDGRRRVPCASSNKSPLINQRWQILSPEFTVCITTTRVNHPNSAAARTHKYIGTSRHPSQTDQHWGMPGIQSDSATRLESVRVGSVRVGSCRVWSGRVEYNRVRPGRI